MTKRIIALSAFIGAISLSIFLFMKVSRGPLIATTESPDKTYKLQLHGRKSRPMVPILEHAVYFDLFRRGTEVSSRQKLHSGDWFDPAFENLYTDHSWVNNSTLMFYREIEAPEGRDIVNVTNNTARPIKFLQVTTPELFLIFDLQPQARTRLSASGQTWLSWIVVEGEFEDGTSIPWKGVNFTIASGLKGPFTYDVAINDDGPTISSPQLPVYRPQ